MYRSVLEIMVTTKLYLIRILTYILKLVYAVQLNSNLTLTCMSLAGT